MYGNKPSRRTYAKSTPRRGTTGSTGRAVRSRATSGRSDPMLTLARALKSVMGTTRSRAVRPAAKRYVVGGRRG